MSTVTPPTTTNWTPRRKVVVAAVAGAVVTVAVGILDMLGVHQTVEMAAAEVVLVSTGLAYLVPEGDQA